MQIYVFDCNITFSIYFYVIGKISKKCPDYKYEDYVPVLLKLFVI